MDCIDCKIIAVDFDGTLCANRWPDIGEPNFELINYIKEERNKGAKIILWTCRTGLELADAIVWCRNHDLMFDAVNENVEEAIELFGRNTRKIFAHEYIDDRMCGAFKLPFEKEKDISVAPIDKKDPGFVGVADAIKEGEKI